MDVNDMINAGYRVSINLDPKEVAAALADAKRHYCDRLAPGLEDNDTDLTSAMMAVAYILLVRRSVVATRSGGKTKLSPAQSENAEIRQTDLDKADTLLRVLQNKPNGVPGNPSQIVDDIARIYFRNVFF